MPLTERPGAERSAKKRGMQEKENLERQKSFLVTESFPVRFGCASRLLLALQMMKGGSEKRAKCVCALRAAGIFLASRWSSETRETRETRASRA